MRHVVNKLQDGIRQVEEWGMKWGFKFSVEKNKFMLFTKKWLREDSEVKLFGNNWREWRVSDSWECILMHD